MTLRGVWEKSLRRDPAAFILAEARTGKTWSRRQVHDEAVRWAMGIAANLRGQRVAFSAENGLEWWRIFLGILLRSGVAVPLDYTELPARRLPLAKSVGADFFWDGQNLLPLGKIRRPPESETCLVKVTSGSTGRPRALAFTDAQMLADGKQICRGMRIQKTDTNYALIPLGHSYGLGNLVVPFLTAGVPVICASSPWPNVVADEIAKWVPTVFPAVPTILQGLVQADVAREKLASLTTVISAGAPLPGELAAAFAEKFGREIHNFYGSSETGGIAYSAQASPTPGAVGTLLPGVELRPLRGARFEIMSRSVFTIKNPRRIGALGAFSPADLGKLSGRHLILNGRVGRTIKVSGKRLNLSEVETSIRSLSDVKGAQVFFRDLPREELAAAVITGISVRELREQLRLRLAPWKIPRIFLLRHEFPMTARGKIDRGTLESQIWPKERASP